jgi:hypothetical protein
MRNRGHNSYQQIQSFSSSSSTNNPPTKSFTLHQSSQKLCSKQLSSKSQFATAKCKMDQTFQSPPKFDDSMSCLFQSRIACSFLLYKRFKPTPACQPRFNPRSSSTYIPKAMNELTVQRSSQKEPPKSSEIPKTPKAQKSPKNQELRSPQNPKPWPRKILHHRNPWFQIVEQLHKTHINP